MAPRDYLTLFVLDVIATFLALYLFELATGPI